MAVTGTSVGSSPSLDPDPDTGNSYIDIATGESYFAKKLNKSAWDDATNSDKALAILQSTLIIDQLNFVGEKADSDQNRQFPRKDDTTVPEAIKNATAEIALALLDGKDPELEFENLDMVTQTYANIKASYNREHPPEYLLAGVPSSTAWRYLLPYIRDPRNIELRRRS